MKPSTLLWISIGILGIYFIGTELPKEASEVLYAGLTILIFVYSIICHMARIFIYIDAAAIDVPESMFKHLNTHPKLYGWWQFEPVYLSLWAITLVTKTIATKFNPWFNKLFGE